MEKEPFFGFLNLNWDHRVGRRPALGSAVPSPAVNPTAFAAKFDSETSPRAEEEDESVASERRGGGTCDDNARKRKATPKAKAKDSTLAAEEDAGAKRPKTAVETKPAEPPKQDYIHVRARRGQATDSHSLAERVRREKISERMKFLQDLVPGCDKVTGKAVMLDEIINYVQSLQRQVEFLSMKLSTVIPRPDFDVDTLFDVKEMNHPRGPIPANPAFRTDAASAGFPYVDLVANGMEARRSVSMQPPNPDGFIDASAQLGAFWDDDLQSIVQMGFGQNQESVFSSQAFQVRFLMPTPTPTPMTHMKIEL